MELQKRKVVFGPGDSVGILLFNTMESKTALANSGDILEFSQLHQAVSQINAPTIKELRNLLNDAEEDPSILREQFRALDKGSIPLGQVLNHCSYVLRDGAPKTSIKRIFFITDDDDPHPSHRQLRVAAKTNYRDLLEAGITVVPFYLSRPGKEFDPSKFYADVFSRPDDFATEEENEASPAITDISTGFSQLLEEMKIREIPKRSLFNIPLILGEGFVIGVKGYGLVTEQKKGQYKYFANMGRTMEEVTSKTIYVDEEQETEVEKDQIIYGLEFGKGGAEGADEAGDGDANEEQDEYAQNRIEVKNKVFFSMAQMRSLRTFDIEPSIKLLGFKDKDELRFEDNVKHSYFIYPNEDAYIGSIRTFSALLKSTHAKEKIGFALAVLRRNTTPVFCALLPQAEAFNDQGVQQDPPGFHLIPLPYADDIRNPPVEKSIQCSTEEIDAASGFIGKLMGKKGYAPDAFLNPALDLHYKYLQATAFEEEFNPHASFSDETIPNYDRIHARANTFIHEWKRLLQQSEQANTMVPTAVKRKAAVSVDEALIRSFYEDGKLIKFRNDELKAFLSQHSLPVSGKKADLIQRIEDYFASHP